mmetsp:Transcript_2676/g.5885  ORF Transcript_2676/g.5885 Transcript_2676/m.5885 type:complete len:201 (-) Transcript_2676:355-957(-)
MHFCRIASGSKFQRGPCSTEGGSDVSTHRKSACAKSSSSSRVRSNVFSQACIRWMFWSITQPPSLATSFVTFTANCSWPCPMEMFTNLPLASVKPNLRAKASTIGVGSVPGKSTKKRGVWAVDSSNVCWRSNGGLSMKPWPRLSTTNCVSAAPILSGLKTRSRNKRWKVCRSRTLRGKSALSARSSANQRFHPSVSCSMW